MPEPEKYLPMNRAELIARCEALEAALRTIAAYRGKNDVAHQLAYIAEAALDSETQPTGNYTDSIDVAESFAAETKVDDPNAPFRWICIHCSTVSGTDDQHCLGCGKARYPLTAAKIKGEQIG